MKSVYSSFLVELRTVNFEKAQRWLFAIFSVGVAMIPLLLPLFSSHIGFNENNKPAVGYTPALYSWSLHNIWFSFMALLVVSIGFYYKKPLRIVLNAELIILLAIVLYAILSVLWAHNVYEAIKSLYLWLCSALAGLIFTVLLRDKRQLHFFLWCLVLSIFFVSLLGILQYLFGVNWVNQASPPASTLGNKNFAAQYALIGIIIGSYLYSQTTIKWQRWFIALSGTLLFSFIGYAHSRSAWFAAFVIAIVVIGTAIYQYCRGRLKIYLAGSKYILGVSLVVLIVLLPLNRDGWSTKNLQLYYGKASSIAAELKGQSKSTRMPIWLNSIALYKKNWLYGVGIGNWHVSYQLYHQAVLEDTTTNLRTVPRYAHNDFLQLLCELGIVFLFLVVILLVVFVTRILYLLASSKQWPLALMCLCIVVGLVTMAQFSSPLHRTMPQTLFFLIIAVLHFCYRTSKTFQKHNPFFNLSVLESKELVLSKRLPQLILLGFFLVTTSYLSHFHYKLNRANAYYWIATTLAKQHREYQFLIAYTQQSLKWNPGRKRLLNYVGGALLQLNKPKEAIPWLLESLRFYPQMYPVMWNLQKAYKATGDIKNELRVLQDLAYIRRLDSNAQFNFGNKLIEIGRIDAAKPFIIKAIELNKTNAKAIALARKHYLINAK